LRHNTRLHLTIAAELCVGISTLANLRQTRKSMRIKNSFWAILGQNVDSTPEVAVEKVRQAMLAALDALQDPGVRALDDKISYARDINALWYLRPDLMNAVASERGEAIASETLNTITQIFKER
jgi:hypothetical protein